MSYVYGHLDEEYDSYASSPYTDTTHYTWPSAPLTPDSPRSGSSSHAYGSDVSGTSSSRRRRREERESTTLLNPAPGVYVNVSGSRRRGGRRGSIVVYGDAPLTPRRSPEPESTRILIRESSPPARERSGRVARPVIVDSRHGSREQVDVNIEIEDRPREPRRRARSPSVDRQRRRNPSNPPSFDRVYSWSDEETSTRRRASRSRSRRRKPNLKVEFADKDEIIESPAVSSVPRALSADTRTPDRAIRSHNRLINSRPAVPDTVIVQPPADHEYKRGHVEVPAHRRRLSREERDQLEFKEQRERLIRRQEPVKAKRRENLSLYAPPMNYY